MGIYSTQTEKKLAIKKQLIQLQTTIETVDGIVTDHGYVELRDCTDKLFEIYEQLEKCNHQGVGLTL